MNSLSQKALSLAGIVFALSSLTACRATQLGAVTKDPTYDSRAMRRVFVVALVKTDRGQKMLEDEFVRQLTSRGREAVASYTLVPRDTKLESDAWKKLILDYGFDTVIISRLVDMKVVEKEYSAKINMPSTVGTGYGYANYYSYSYAAVYQPSSYVREQTASVETRVFDLTSGKEVWSAHSKTEIAWGGDPVPQVRTFVKTLFNTARR